MTDTHTDTQTYGNQIFYCFIVFRDLNNVQKSHKKWGYINFIFRMNSIFRHSNASRSNKPKRFLTNSEFFCELHRVFRTLRRFAVCFNFY
jgi:hypothetical protein